jgi:hypothetical protein
MSIYQKPSCADIRAAYDRDMNSAALKILADIRAMHDMEMNNMEHPTTRLARLHSRTYTVDRESALAALDEMRSLLSKVRARGDRAMWSEAIMSRAEELR